MKRSPAEPTEPLPAVLIDARMVKAVPDGFVLYVQGLVRGLREVATKKKGLGYRPILLVSKSEQARIDRGEARWPEGFKTQVSEVPFLSAREIWALPGEIARAQARVYHSPTFSSPAWCPAGTAAIVTIHDLNHLTYGTWDKKVYYWMLLRRFARQAGQVLSVSETAAREIEAWMGWPRGHVGVAYNSVAWPEGPGDPRTLAENGLERGRYFLCMANAKPHKNTALLLRAYAQYLQRAEVGAAGPWKLVLAHGVDDRTRREFGQNLVAFGEPGIGPGQYATLLESAGGVAWPSLYEGFGRPPVEAALAGIPLVVSDIPVHREVLRDLGPGEALWVPPTDVEAWTQALTAITANEQSPARPSEASRHAMRERFSALKLGECMDRYYQSMLGQV